ncbi:MAG: hypothetical protein RLZZ04_147 [Cyanobacteriota bacterium]|jgi:hypothetical protein
MFTSKIKVKPSWSIGLLTAIAIAGGQSSVKAEPDNMLGDMGSEQFLQTTAKMMNSSLPLMVDENVRWDSSSAGPGKTLSYNYTLINTSAKDVYRSMFVSNIRKTITHDICEVPVSQIFSDNDVTLNFNYYDRSHNLITKVEVDPKDCR